MRPLVMDFHDDYAAVNHKYEYMFGKSILVAPVIRPDVTEWDVYLPKSSDWFDFWTGKKFNGGQNIQASAPLNKIPMFVKAGSIIPMGKFIQYTGQKNADTLEIRIYTGVDCKFQLYEDEGDNYNYEKGQYSTINFEWSEKERTLSIDEPHGQFAGMLQKRVFNIIWIDQSSGNGINYCKVNKQVKYEGKKLVIDK